jgi:hypothetical protein
MGVKSPAPISPREAGHRSRDIILLFRWTDRWIGMTQAEYVPEKRDKPDRQTGHLLDTHEGTCPT